MILPTPECVQLFLDGASALAKVEHDGVRVDEARLDRSISEVQAQIKALSESLRRHQLCQEWKRKFGAKANLGSGQQLAWLVYTHLGYLPRKYTDTGQPSVDESALETVNEPFVDDYVRLKKLHKIYKTYLLGVKAELAGGFLHPFFHLHTTKTGRSSSKSVNFQNLPIRDPEMGKLVRDCIVPRKGWRFAETDFSTLEFIVAACIWGDEGMLAYARDSQSDIHKDFAARCYKCERSQVSKMMRSIAKNQFVFPILYGSYYVSCARGLWESIDKFSLALADGTPLKRHLESVGVKSLGLCDPRQRPRPGTFEYLTKQTEDHFYSSFPTFAQRKEERWREYLRTGGFRTVHGFACNGEYTRNFFQNAVVQSPAFGCLLQSLVWLQNWLVDKQSLIVAQIHDCILKDVVDKELQEVLDATEYFMTEKLAQEWSWLTVPFKVEVDVTSIDGTWAEKAPWAKRDGVWGPK